MNIRVGCITALFLLSSGIALAQSITITSPSDGAVVSGTYIFSAAGKANIASVEYRLGSLSLGIASPPFGLGWNTGYTADGDYSVTAIAYDSIGAVVGTADRQFSIQNHRRTLHISSPDLSKPLSKTVTIAAAANDPSSYPARWIVAIDGILLTYIWSDNSAQNAIAVQSPPIDTTRFSNGQHELHIEVTSDSFTRADLGNKTWYNGTVGLSRVITIDNGHTQMGVAANYQHVYLEPGQTIKLSCRSLFTDNVTGSCTAPSYSSSDAAVAQVQPSGMLKAGPADGFSTVFLKDKDFTTQVYVWVERHPAIPHFSGNGQMLTSYQAGVSIFPVAPFVLQTSDAQVPAMNEEIKRAGINTLYSGFYLNPRDLSASYDSWQRNYDQVLGTQWSWAAANGYHVYAMGDEVTRNIGLEAWWTLNWPYGRQAVQHAMQSLAASGVAIGVDIIDEGSMLWGGTPTPSRKIGEAGMFTSITCSGATCTVAWPSNPVKPTRFYAGVQFALTGSTNAGLNTPLGQMFTAQNVADSSFDFVPASNVTGVFTPSNDPNLEFLWWAGSAGGCPRAPCTPPVPNTALSTVAGWLRSAPVHVPISWPALGIHPPTVQDQWAGKDSQVSDFFSHYWDSFLAGRTYTWSAGIADRVLWMRNAFYSRQAYARLDRPQIILASSSSFFYRKNTPDAAYYTPPADTLIIPGTSGPAISAEMMAEAALGNAGIRLYQFESPSQESNRTKSKIGSEMQTGMSPVAGDQNSRQIWRSAAYVSNLLTKTLQPFILGTPLSSPSLGDNIVTAVRRSNSGVLLMVVNANDWERTVSIELTPYKTGQPITRYAVRSRGITSAVVADTASKRVTIGAGETVVYLFPNSGATSWISALAIAAPALPAGAQSAILHHGYIYSQDMGYQTDGMECTEGCMINVDAALGDIVYQFVFTDAQGNVLGKSVTRTISKPGRRNS
jgi:hypothetical protein